MMHVLSHRTTKLACCQVVTFIISAASTVVFAAFGMNAAELIVVNKAETVITQFVMHAITLKLAGDK